MLPTHIAPTVKIGDKDYTVELLSMAALGRLQGLINQQPNPKPFTEALREIEGWRSTGLIPDDDAKAMRAQAYRDRDTWPPELLGATAFEAQRFLHFDETIRAEFLVAALKPKPTADEAKAIAETIGLKAFMDIVNAALGIEDEGKADPKAQAPEVTDPGSTGASTTGK